MSRRRRLVWATVPLAVLLSIASVAYACTLLGMSGYVWLCPENDPLCNETTTPTFPANQQTAVSNSGDLPATGLWTIRYWNTADPAPTGQHNACMASPLVGGTAESTANGGHSRVSGAGWTKAPVRLPPVAGVYKVCAILGESAVGYANNVDGTFTVAV